MVFGNREGMVSIRVGMMYGGGLTCIEFKRTLPLTITHRTIVTDLAVADWIDQKAKSAREREIEVCGSLYNNTTLLLFLFSQKWR